MALLAIIYVCSIFMIGRNVISLITKIIDLLKKEKRMELNEAKSQYFIYAALIFTAVAGITCGIGLLFENQAFGIYMFPIVSGMMIYSYITYLGKTYEDKNWIMFVVSIIVILLILSLVFTLGAYMAGGGFD